MVSTTINGSVTRALAKTHPQHELERRQADPGISMSTLAGFELLQRIAKVFASSDIVPPQYQGNSGMANCIIAIEMASRIGASPLQVMQNLYIVHGRPGWSSQFLIATFNSCGRFAPIQYEEEGKAGANKDWRVRAITSDLRTGRKIEGPWIDWDLVTANEWNKRNGSKWLTMPQLMGQYRAAAWMIRTVAPEISMGIRTAEEVVEVVSMPAESYRVTPPNIEDLPLLETMKEEPKEPLKEEAKPAITADTLFPPDEWEQLMLEMVAFDGDAKTFARTFSAKIGQAPPDRKEALMAAYKANRELR